MYEDGEAKNLIESERWRLFLESTATALQINLIFQVIGTQSQISVCDRCPVCAMPIPDFNRQSECDWTESEDAVTDVFNLSNKYRVIVQDYTCCKLNVSLNFSDKVSIAKELLGSFLVILTDQWSGEQLHTELATLRQINHIILSMFRGDNNALELVLDLILCAAVILFDAGGSWLEYEIDSRRHTMTKGNITAITDSVKSSSVSATIDGAAVQGVLGIVDPVYVERADAFLGFMVQECTIAFEIDTLLKLMESKMSIILGSIDDLVLLVDKRKYICYANKAAMNILSRPIQELIDLPIDEIDAPWRDSFISQTDKAVKGMKDPLNSLHETRIIDWEVYPLKGGTDIPGWLVLAKDCTDNYRLQELGEKTERLVSTLTLLNVMAHEIRNPLATFKGLFQIIEMNSSPEMKKYIDIGQREITRLTVLLNDYMQLGKSLVSTMEKTDLNAFVTNLIPLLNMEFGGEAIELRTFMDTVSPVQIDKRQMTQVIINIVKNAYEALNHQGKITLRLYQHNDAWVELSVSDNGPGIPEPVIVKLFKPYFSTKPEGSGLGLAICQTIIQNHGGTISVCNNPYGGACFTMRLPAFREPTLNNPKNADVLLLVDDDMIRYPAERIFRVENIKYLSVDKRCNLSQIIRRSDPSVVFIDEDFFEANMLDGFLQNVRGEKPQLKIILGVTGFRSQPSNNIFYITKPINYSKLINLIKDQLTDHREGETN